MKKIILTVLAIAVVAISLSSCKKDELAPSCEGINMIRITGQTMPSLKNGCTVHEIKVSPGKEEN